MGLFESGTYELPKERATAMHTWVPSNSNLLSFHIIRKVHIYKLQLIGLCDAIKCKCMCIKLIISSVNSIECSSIHDMSDYFQKVSYLRMQFVFRWHSSYCAPQIHVFLLELKYACQQNNSMSNTSSCIIVCVMKA